MKRRLPIRPLCATLALLAATAVTAPAFAAGADLSKKFMGLPTWVWLSVNLVVFASVLGYFLVPPIKNFLNERAKKIEADLAEAARQRAEVADMQATVAAKLAELDAEVSRVSTRAETEGVRERDEIVAQATRERDRLLAQAKIEIDHRVGQAKKELAEHTAKLAAKLAQEELERRIGPEERRGLFATNVTRLEKEVRP